MKYLKGDVLWCIPIRYWEDKEPTKCIVEKDEVTHEYSTLGGVKNNDSLYVYAEEYKHNVYIDRAYLFFDKEKAIKAIEAYNTLHDLYRKDESSKMAKRVWENVKNDSKN
jgi:hypothetical protein